MKTQIDTTEETIGITYPRLMTNSKGAIIMYVTACQGTVLYTTTESIWAVGDEVRTDIKWMVAFHGVLRLWN